MEQLRANPPVDPWEIKDVRWEPSNTLPLKATTTKYGKPDSDETDEQFRRILNWEQRGISAYVSTTDKITLLIFEFTIGDYFCKGKWAEGETCDPLDPSGSKSSASKHKRQSPPSTSKRKPVNSAK